MHRLNHKHLTEAEFLLKQQKWNQMEPTLPANYDFEEEHIGYTPGGSVAGFTSGVDRSASNASTSPRRRKDEKMAEDDPMRYCADRCVSTGNCDVFEVRNTSCDALFGCIYHVLLWMYSS